MARPARPMPDSQRRALLDAMAGAVLEHGYEKASLNAVLATAGIGKSTFYHRFRDKRALLAELLTDRLQVLHDHVRLPEPGELGARDYWVAIDALLDSLTRAAETEPRTLEAGRLLHTEDLPPLPALAEGREHLAAWVQAMLERGRELGCVDTGTPAPLQRSLALAVAIEVDRWALEQGADAPSHRIAGDVLRRLLSPT